MSQRRVLTETTDCRSLPHPPSALDACRYDPYGRALFREQYDQRGMRAARRAAIEKARRATSWGLVLGTLGRQGNPALLAKIRALLVQRGIKHSVVLLSEVMPHKLAQMSGVDAWVQIACPRCAPERELFRSFLVLCARNTACRLVPDVLLDSWVQIACPLCARKTAFRPVPGVLLDALAATPVSEPTSDLSVSLPVTAGMCMHALHRLG